MTAKAGPCSGSSRSTPWTIATDRSGTGSGRRGLDEDLVGSEPAVLQRRDRDEATIGVDHEDRPVVAVWPIVDLDVTWRSRRLAAHQRPDRGRVDRQSRKIVEARVDGEQQTLERRGILGGRRPDRLDVDHRLEPELATCGPDERAEVRGAAHGHSEVTGKGPDVGTRRAFDVDG